MSDQLRSANTAYYAAKPQLPVSPAAPPSDYPEQRQSSSELRSANVAYYRSRQGSALRPSYVQFHGEPPTPAYVIPQVTEVTNPAISPESLEAFPFSGPLDDVLHRFQQPSAAVPPPNHAPGVNFFAVSQPPVSESESLPSAPAEIVDGDEDQGDGLESGV